jgi:hypothetical protein
MDPMVLAKCWTLDDKTTCLLSKVGVSTWELRVMRESRLLRVEFFGNLAVAIAVARDWRASFADQIEGIA